MKVKNLIKADFFIAPANYGFSNNFPFTEDEIWKKVIKPNIEEVINVSHILNSNISGVMPKIRRDLSPYVNEWYDLLKKP